MVDPEPGHRPKRAYVEPAAPDDPPAPDSSGQAGPVTPAPSAGPAAAAPQTPRSNPTGGADLPAAAAGDGPPPLYRDEVAGAAGRPAAGVPGPLVPEEETRIVRPLNFQQRRRAASDDDATSLLPRTAAGRRRAAVEELDPDEHRSLLGRRGRLALLAGALLAVVVVGIALIVVVSSVGSSTNQPSPGTSTGSTPASGSPTPATDPSALLGDDQLLTTAAADRIEPDSVWKVALTQRGPAPADAPTAACLSNEPVDGEPAARQEALRVLSGSGKGTPSVLHQAAAYATPADAAQAYAVAVKTFGGCASPGAYIFRGASVTGVGDQSTGLVVNVVTGGKTEWHTVVVTRTGRVLDVVDAARGGSSVRVAQVAGAAAAVSASQCQPAGGSCDATPAVKVAAPPLGGDVPGFLATGDLPPAGSDESWVATPAEEPSKDFLGSQCETVTWSRTGADVASSRVYLVPSSTKFGLNDIVLTMKNEQAANALVAKIRADLRSCGKRQLTATVSEPAAVRGVGAAGAAVTGWTATVSQKATTGTQRYRVGIVSSGAKVAYTFLNPLDGGYDLTAAEWDEVAVRAGQRMTQVP